MKTVALSLLMLAFGSASQCFGQDVKLSPTTCPTVSDDALSKSILAASARADILLLRHTVEEFAASIDSYAICLNSALAALRSERLHDGGSVHPLVPVIVTNLLQAATSEKRTILSSYSLAVSAYNSKHATPEGLDGVSDLNIAYALPPESAMIPIPAGSRLLSIPAHSVFNGIASSACFEESRKALRTGPIDATALVAFDVGAAGELSNVHLVQSSGLPSWDQVALVCTANRQYAPQILDGDPVPSPNHVTPMKFEVGPSHRNQ